MCQRGGGVICVVGVWCEGRRGRMLADGYIQT